MRVFGLDVRWEAEILGIRLEQQDIYTHNRKYLTTHFCKHQYE